MRWRRPFNRGPVVESNTKSTRQTNEEARERDDDDDPIRSRDRDRDTGERELNTRKLYLEMAQRCRSS